MLSFRYSSIFFYTFLCFSAGMSKGAVNPQNKTILARVLREGATLSVDATAQALAVTKINENRKKMTEFTAATAKAADMPKVQYSKCLALIAEDVVKKCDEKAPIPTDKYGEGKKIAAIYHHAETKLADIGAVLLSFPHDTLDATSSVCAESATCIPFAKMVYSKAMEVGCAELLCKSFKDKDAKKHENHHATVCLFGPEVYKPGTAPFAVGATACSSCADSKSCLTEPSTDVMFCATAYEPTEECVKTSSKNEGDDSKSTEDGKKGGKKKSMGVQSAKPQTVLAVAATAILSLFLAH